MQHVCDMKHTYRMCGIHRHQRENAGDYMHVLLVFCFLLLKFQGLCHDAILCVHTQKRMESELAALSRDSLPIYH